MIGRVDFEFGLDLVSQQSVSKFQFLCPDLSARTNSRAVAQLKRGSCKNVKCSEQCKAQAK